MKSKSSQNESAPGLDGPGSGTLVTINGREAQAMKSENLGPFLTRLEMNRPGTAVEVNGQLVARDRLASVELSQGDQIEVVSFVGGG